MRIEQFDRGRLPVAAAVSLMLASVASADEAARKIVEEVIVTGSHIQGTPEDSAMPVEVITLEDLEALGRPSNMDLVKTMSEVGTVAGEADRDNRFPIGAASVNLRNLGSRFTTVIFNGRRFPEQNATIGRFNNINWIPSAAIGQVEVLKEGGAVTYGADAIGGVVNYITRRNFNDLELSADYRFIENSDGDYSTNLLWGSVFASGNFLLSAGYDHRSTLLALDRSDWARRDYLENDSGWSANGSPGSYIFQTAQTNTGAPGFTSITPGAPAQGQDASPLPGVQPSTGLNRYTGNQQMSVTGVVRDPQCAALGGFAGWSTTPSPVCYFQQIQFEQLVNETNTYHLFAELNFAITDNVEFHGEGLYLQQNLPSIPKDPSDGPGAWPLSDSTFSGRQQVGTSPAYFVAGNNPAVLDFLSNFRNADGTQAFTAEQIAAITSAGRVGLAQQTWRPFGNGGNPLSGRFDVQENESKVWRFTGALSGDLPQWFGSDLDWEVALTYSHVTSRADTRDMLVDRLQAALNGFGGANCNGIQAGRPGSTCQWFNPFSSAIARNIYTGEVNPGFVPSLQNDPDMVRWLYVPIWAKGTYNNIVFDPIVRGRLGWNLPGGPVAVALGGQFRWGSEETQLDDLSNRAINPCATPGVTDCPEAIRTGPLVFTRPTFVFGTSLEQRRHYPVVAGFGEVQMPLLDSLNLQLAGRYEKFYSDVTDKDNEVFVPAGAIKWQPLSWLALRASAGNTFSQVNPPRDDGPTIRGSFPNSTFGNVGSAVNETDYTSASYDNIDIDPEKGSYLDVGLLVQASNFSASIDYWDIRIKNYARAMLSSQVIAALVEQGQTPAIDNLINCSSPLLSPRSNLNGRPFVELNGPCVQGVSRLNSPRDSDGDGPLSGQGGIGGGRINTLDQTNGGELKTTGIDMSASYAFDGVFGGVLRPSVDVSYILQWQMGDYEIFGIPVAEGYDARGFRNTSAGRTGGQVVPDYRGSIGLNYSRGKHSVNVIARYIPSVINENPNDFDASNDQNANIGNASGVVTEGTGAATTCAVPLSNMTSDLGAAPPGAGSGQYGSGGTSVSSTGTPLANVVGFCGGQNTAILSGQKIASYSNIDVTYRLQMANDTDLSFTIYNLLNEDPSFSREVLSYDSGFGSPLGRNFKLTVRKRF